MPSPQPACSPTSCGDVNRFDGSYATGRLSQRSCWILVSYGLSGALTKFFSRLTFKVGGWLEDSVVINVFVQPSRAKCSARIRQKVLESVLDSRLKTKVRLLRLSTKVIRSMPENATAGLQSPHLQVYDSCNPCFLKLANNVVLLYEPIGRPGHRQDVLCDPV